MKITKARLRQIIKEEISLHKKKQKLQEMIREEVKDILNEVSTAFTGVKGGKRAGFKSAEQQRKSKVVDKFVKTKDTRKTKFDTEKAAADTKKSTYDTKTADADTKKTTRDTRAAEKDALADTLSTANNTKNTKETELNDANTTLSNATASLTQANATLATKTQEAADAKSALDAANLDHAPNDKAYKEASDNLDKAMKVRKDAKAAVKKETDLGRYEWTETAKAIPKEKWISVNGPFKTPLPSKTISKRTCLSIVIADVSSNWSEINFCKLAAASLAGSI